MRITMAAWLLCLASSAAALPLSQVPRAYPVHEDRMPTPAMVVADLDLDGKRDVVVDGVETGTILYGRGDGALEMGPRLVAGGWQSAYASNSVVADVDGNGYPDIVSNDYREEPFKVVLHRSIRGRAFAEPATIYRGARPVAAGDFTGDGVPDILLATSTGTAYGVLLINDGLGSFTVRNLGNVDFLGDPGAGDFDGDGDLDIACSYRLFLNDGRGNFGRRSTAHSYEHPVIADLDKDGRADVIGLRWHERKLVILRGSNLLADISTIDADSSPVAGTAGDFNNDGHLDLAVMRDNWRTYQERGSSVSYDEPGVDVYLGDGTGHLTSRFRFTIASPGLAIGAADVNRDGRLDLLVPVSQGIVATVIGNGDGTFRIPQRLPGLRPSYGLRAGDLNGDGVDELLLITNDETHSVGWMKDDGSYAFEPVPVSAPNAYFIPLAFASLGESRASLVMATDKTIHVLSATAPGQWTDRTFDAGDTVMGLQTWREGNEGRIGVITGPASAPLLKVFSATGAELHTGTILGPGKFPPPPFRIDAADLDGDGITDLIVSRLSTLSYSFHTWYVGNDGYVSIVRGRGKGTFGPQEVKVAGRALRAFMIGDANQDGTIDVLAETEYYTPKPVAFLNDGRGNFVERNDAVTRIPLLIEDLDSDGVKDLHYGSSIVFGRRTEVRYAISVPALVVRRRNAARSLVGIDYLDFALVVVDLDAPPRVRAARH